MNVCAVVLNYANAPDALACLDSLLTLREEGLDGIIVVDNASPDNSRERIADWARLRLSPDEVRLAQAPDAPLEEAFFHLMAAPDNGGYARGNNLGLRAALAAGARFCWVLNNDVVVRPGALAALLRGAAAHPEAGCLGASLEEFHRPGVLQCAAGGRVGNLTGKARHFLAGVSLEQAQAHAGPEDFDFVIGASMFLPRRALCEAGLFREDFFLFYEDEELCRRLRDRGFSLVWVRDCVVAHKGRATMSRDGAASVRHAAHGYALRLRLGRSWSALWLGPAHVAMHALHYLATGRLRNLRNHLEGFARGLFCRLREP